MGSRLVTTKVLLEKGKRKDLKAVAKIKAVTRMPVGSSGTGNSGKDLCDGSCDSEEVPGYEDGRVQRMKGGGAGMSKITTPTRMFRRSTGYSTYIHPFVSFPLFIVCFSHFL